jgi:hypothetical protein
VQAVDAAPTPAPDAAPAPRITGSGPAGCLVDAEVTAATRQTEAANDAAFHAEMARAGLALIELPIHTWEASEMGPAPANPVVKRTIRKRDARLLLYGTVAGGCGAFDAADFPFGRDGNTIYRIDRRVTQRSVEISVCPRTTCPQANITCGGALRITGLGFELPPGTTYGGVRTITHPADYLVPRHDQGVGVMCPAPPKPS